MCDDNKFWLRTWIVVTVATCIISLGCTALYQYKVIRMAELGYQEVAYPGSATSFFQKASN